ncbi:hypothetical protein ABID59_005090 [Bradyrhizobium sp. S3.3.6]
MGNIDPSPPKARIATMTSISALSTHHHQHTSPLQRLQDELQSEVSSGTISASDQSALSSALDDIDSSLQSDGTSNQSSGSGPDGIKSKIDDLIRQEVSSGKLTDQQATELQGIFKSAFAHGPGGAGGPPPFNAPPPVSGTDSSSSGTNSSSSGNSTADLLEKFLDSLKASLADSTYSGTGSNGTSNPSDPSLSNVLLNDRI